MKPFLMFKDQDFEIKRRLPDFSDDLISDLGLSVLIEAMAGDDKYLTDIIGQTLVSSLTEPEAIRHRQDILKDCLKNPDVVKELYQITIDSITLKQKSWLGIFSRSPSGILHEAVEIVEVFVMLLQKLKQIAPEHVHKFDSTGFTAFFAMIEKELSNEYLESVETSLQDLKFKRGALISAELGTGNEGANHILRKPLQRNWWKSMFKRGNPVYSFSIHERDDAGAHALSDLNDRGIQHVSRALALAADHLDKFFTMLRAELAFYIGCMNLYDRLSKFGSRISFPNPSISSNRNLRFQQLYNVSLALTMNQKVVANDASADNKDLIIITGANQGGKSVFMQSIGQAQVMMQCGMFVTADSFAASVSKNLFTHYKRKEDPSMESGKLDEEFKRMSKIVDHLTTDSMMLFNESFAATNEREGSEIARQITTALVEKHVRVIFVTHLYEFAHDLYENNHGSTIFLQPERKPDGSRTFRLIEGEPSQTSFGEDVYKAVFEGG
jgi:adenosyl cobinamide kinase/adenosyl cobinamide phosphate guanylyltransferase